MINKARLLKRSMIVALLLFIGFAGGTYFGFSFTSSYTMFGTYVPNGELATAQLLQLEKGNSALTKDLLERQVDSGLAEYSYASEEWWFPLYKDGWTLMPPEKVESYMHNIATYRKHHPSPSRNVFSNMSKKWKQNPDNQALETFSRDYQHRINAMVGKFAN